MDEANSSGGAAAAVIIVLLLLGAGAGIAWKKGWIQKFLKKPPTYDDDTIGDEEGTNKP